ncbi:hypothetical protein UM764_05260 [Staphylococcus aureus]|nr:hypothetical protein UM764_05260 [Staphylococcus aureus]
MGGIVFNYIDPVAFNLGPLKCTMVWNYHCCRNTTWLLCCTTCTS